MEKNDFKALLRRTVAIPVIALAILATVLLLEIQSLNSSLQWVDHTDQVVGASEQLAKLIVDMESAMRGFLGSGNEAFLLPADQDKLAIDAQFENIKQLVSDSPSQQAQLAVVRQRFDEFLRYEQGRIELRRTTGTRLEASLQGKQLMDALRATHDARQAGKSGCRGATVGKSGWLG
jgi:CHASE3 domain sensor protein